MSYNALNIWFALDAWPKLQGVCCSLLDADGKPVATRPMTGLAIVGDAADADDVEFGEIPHGHLVDAVRIHVGERGIFRQSMKFKTTGGTITVEWHNGTLRIFRLVLP